MVNNTNQVFVNVTMMPRCCIYIINNNSNVSMPRVDGVNGAVVIMVNTVLMMMYRSWVVWAVLV